MSQPDDRRQSPEAGTRPFGELDGCSDKELLDIAHSTRPDAAQAAALLQARRWRRAMIEALQPSDTVPMLVPVFITAPDETQEQDDAQPSPGP